MAKKELKKVSFNEAKGVDQISSTKQLLAEKKVRRVFNDAVVSEGIKDSQKRRRL